ncbi:MAG: RHS repeat-associated core domain-containing protein, partial [Bacteroidales bacterium]|nr:RHS repeat-associated core domain-containing protein [Bacteroidales bacterium]
DLYFYHGDHLGSASWITDARGDAIQHLQYLPFGETRVDQRTSYWTSRYSFSGKEKDEETGYSYFGARYYDSDLSIWLSVDPLSDKYPFISPYVYCEVI